MEDCGEPNGRPFARIHAAEETAMERAEQRWENEGGHMSSTAGRVVQRIGEDLPFVAILSHDGSEPTEHAFMTMREAEAFIKRNTPVPGRALSRLYDRPAGD
jgi:hypothetical protein